MCQPQLPLECITIIICFVHNNGDTETMGSLLRINKTICAAALPFLYKDCFGRLTRPFPTYRSINGPKLVQTLLRQIHPQSRIPDILKVTFLSPDKQTDLESTAQPSPPPVFKYGRFLSRVDVSFESIHYMSGYICNSYPLMVYAISSRQYETFSDEYTLLQEKLMADICHQLTWTLCQDHPERINSLTISLKDIQRYIDHVHLFTSLSSVKFSIREPGCIHWDRYTSDPTRGIEEPKRDRFFRGMVEFVRQHTFIYKNVLRNVEVPQSTELYRTGQHSIPHAYYAIQSLLPSFQNTRSITTGRIELLARSADTNLSCLESITVLPCSGSLQAEEISELLSRHPPFLSRYRSLKHLTTETLGPDMFQWAVLEKKQKEAERQQESIVGRHLSSWQHGYHTSNLVRLQSISISKSKQPPIDQELNDIAFAFSDSLEEWNVEDGIERGYKVQEDDTVITHGQGWDLPRLRRLSLKMFGVRLHFDMDGLKRCRALESLTMHDGLVTYRHRDIRWWSVVCLPHLKKLDLKGSPASHFNMDSLHQSPCLEELTMEMTPIAAKDDFGDGRYHMPSPGELEHEDSDTEGVDNQESSGMPGSSQEYRSTGKKPQYTWDWYLPSLRKLDLTAVFALMFDFRWLQHLPNLQSLRLDISSDETAHLRHITLKDLLRREPQQAPDEDGSGEILSDRYISSPKLESIALDGGWIFEKEVMDILCLTVAPNLSSFHCEGSHADLSLRECIALSRRMPRLKKVELEVGFSYENPNELGLRREDRLSSKWKEGVLFVNNGYKYYLAPRCGPSRKSGRN